MINLRYYQFTFRWIMICFILFNFTSIVQANQAQCDDSCNLKIQDEDVMYAEFKKLAMSDSVRVIFFHIQIGNQSFNQGNDMTVYFAWIKNSFGRAILTLPNSFMLMSLSLYTIFIGSMKIAVIDPTQDCYRYYSNDEKCRHQIIFKALVNFTQLNHTCNDKYCPTICQRQFTGIEEELISKISASCCQKNPLNSHENITTCLTNQERPLFYVQLSAFLLITLSFCLAGITLNKTSNWWIASIQR